MTLENFKPRYQARKQEHLNHLRLQVDKKYQEQHTSVKNETQLDVQPEDKLQSDKDSTSNDHVRGTKQSYDDLKRDARYYQRLVSKMDFGRPRSRSQMKEVLSDYGQLLLGKKESLVGLQDDNTSVNSDEQHGEEQTNNLKVMAESRSKFYSSGFPNYFANLLYKSPGLSMKTLVGRLNELHEELIKRIDNLMKNPVISNEKLINGYQKQKTLASISEINESASHQLQGDQNQTSSQGYTPPLCRLFVESMKSTDRKETHNENLLRYIMKIDDLLQVEAKLQHRIKETENQTKKIDAKSDKEDHIQVAKTSEGTKVGEMTHARDSDSWPPLNAHEIEKWHPKNITLHDVYSVIHNDQGIDETIHEKQLEAMAYRATEWIIDHAWNPGSNDKRKALYEYVQSLYLGKKETKEQKQDNINAKEQKQDEEDLYEKVRRLYQKEEKTEEPKEELKVTAEILSECVIREGIKSERSRLSRSFHAVIDALGSDEQQSAKMDLVNRFGAQPERYKHVQKKSSQLEPNSRYNKRHRDEIGKLRKIIDQTKVDNERETKLFQVGQERIDKISKAIIDLEKKLSNQDLGNEERKNLALELKIHKTLQSSIPWMESGVWQNMSRDKQNQQIRAAETALGEHKKTAFGVLAGLGFHAVEAAAAFVALGLSSLALHGGAMA